MRFLVFFFLKKKNLTLVFIVVASFFFSEKDDIVFGFVGFIVYLQKINLSICFFFICWVIFVLVFFCVFFLKKCI